MKRKNVNFKINKDILKKNYGFFFLQLNKPLIINSFYFVAIIFFYEFMYNKFKKYKFCLLNKISFFKYFISLNITNFYLIKNFKNGKTFIFFLSIYVQ